MKIRLNLLMMIVIAGFVISPLLGASSDVPPADSAAQELPQQNKPPNFDEVVDDGLSFEESEVLVSRSLPTLTGEFIDLPSVFVVNYSEAKNYDWVKILLSKNPQADLWELKNYTGHNIN